MYSNTSKERLNYKLTVSFSHAKFNLKKLFFTRLTKKLKWTFN